MRKNKHHSGICIIIALKKVQKKMHPLKSIRNKGAYWLKFLFITQKFNIEN